ncbi:uncharacterized protein LOC113500161 [Trichoplusia ni]|uniref:Uncharacterized protein LOC113500161 n=1 Tax=Trichoplusia ni TaxID=7111 RepID=A0A7E5W7L4_TRINI|nr:uncharacterized protein LOC113500161 [Trichoplusia ni]
MIMSTELFYRRQVSHKHLEVLAQYMERFPPLALASARSREGHLQSKRMWEKIARTLNRIDAGVNKSGRSWARYWIDLKFKIRRKYAVVQKCEAEGSHCAVSLSPLEARIARILTDEEGNLLPTASVYHQVKGYPRCDLKDNGKTRHNIKSIDSKITDTDDTSQNYLIDHTEHITIPDDVKPNIKDCVDPIQISPIQAQERGIEELKRDLVEFELKKQRELFEMEKEFRREKHEIEMSILRIRKQIMLKELQKL